MLILSFISHLVRQYWTWDAKQNNPNGKIEEYTMGYIQDSENLKKTFFKAISSSLKSSPADFILPKKEEKVEKNEKNERNVNSREREREGEKDREKERERDREKEKERDKIVTALTQPPIKKQKTSQDYPTQTNNLKIKNESTTRNSNNNNNSNNNSNNNNNSNTLNLKLSLPNSHIALSAPQIATANPVIVERKIAKYCRETFKELLIQVSELE